MRLMTLQNIGSQSVAPGPAVIASLGTARRNSQAQPQVYLNHTLEVGLKSVFKSPSHDSDTQI